MRFSVSQWELDPQDEKIDFLKNQNVTAIETGPDFLLKYKEAEIETIAEKYSKAGIEFYSMHAPFGVNDDLSDLDNVKRRKIISVFKEFILRAPLAGVKCLIVHPGDAIKNDDENKRLNQFKKSLEVLLPLAEKNNLLLAVENMPPTSIGFLVSSIVKIVKEFDSPALGICLDTGHLNNTNENMIEAFELAREKIIAFHFHDNDGERDLHLQPPYGTFDWNALIGQINKYNFEFPALVEAKPWNVSSPRQLLKEVAALFSGRLLEEEISGRRVNLICEKCKHYIYKEKDKIFCGCGEGKA